MSSATNEMRSEAQADVRSEVRSFQEILGHDKHRGYFERLIANGDLSHAYCFSGLAGIGKMTFAKALARAVLCGDRQQDLSKFDSGNHPDYLVVTPDGASIKTEQIEAVHQFMHIKPLLSQRKVVLIDDAHEMTEVAQNKLLKLLEEPPGHALFVLVTNNSLKLLETVRSRVVTLNFHPLEQRALEMAILNTGLPLNQDILAASLGSLSRYCRWQEDQAYGEAIHLILRGLKALCEGKPAGWLGMLKAFEVMKDDTVEILDFIYVWFLDLTLVKQGVDPSHLRLSFEYENMVQCKQYVTTHALATCQELVHSAQVALERQQNSALVVEAMFFDIQEAIHGKGNRRTL